MLLLSLFVINALAQDKAYLPEIKSCFGNVTVLSPNKSKKQDCKPGLILNLHDHIQTDKTGIAVIALPEGSEIKVNGDTEVSLDWTTKKTSVGLLSGSIFNKVRQFIKTKRGYEVETKTAVMGVRGTEFFSSNQWMCVRDGEVEVKTANQKKIVPAGKGIFIKAGEKLEEPKAYEWTKELNWNFSGSKNEIENKVNLKNIYTDSLTRDYD